MAIKRERDLVTPPPTLGGLQELSGPVLVAIVIASGIAVLDGVAGPALVLIGLLAIPPVIAAMSASVPETGVVAAFCVLMAVLSGLWNQNIGENAYVVEVLTALAGGVAGLWIAGLRLDLMLEQNAAELMGEAGALLETELTMEARAQTLADLAVPALGDVAMVDMITPEGTISRMAAKSSNPELAKLFTELRQTTPIVPGGPHPVAEVIRSGEPMELDQLSDAEIEGITSTQRERKLLSENRFQSCLVLPLGARGSVLGALTLSIMRPSNRFDRIARRTAGRLSARAALAIDNARLHEQQSHIAAVLQSSLLPRMLPEIRGFETAARFEAAGQAHWVGGDFYDVFRTGSGTWTVVMGDVCGKGPEAAALTALARYTIRTASGPSTAPSTVLRTLHESILAERDDMRFCTAALVGLSSPSNGRGSASLTVSLGGHPPPLALRRNGKVEVVGEPGTLLGAFPDPTVVDVDAKLAPGDALVLYTDGMLENRDRRKADDPNWLVDQLAGHAGSSADEIAGELAKAAIKRQGGEPRDDIAVLVLRRS